MSPLIYPLHLHLFQPLSHSFHFYTWSSTTTTYSKSRTTTPPLVMNRSPPQATEEAHNHTTSGPSSSSAAMPNTSSGHMGKHRMSAAISLLNQQIQIIQDELDELETIGGVSTVCPDLIATVESVPDALLPVTRGPVEVSWERWFQGAQSSRSRRRWI